VRQLLVHPLSQQHLDSLTHAPSHAILLAGPAGSGKVQLARRLAEDILSLEAGEFMHYPYGLTVGEGADTSIGIEAIRQLEQFLGRKVPSDKTYHRAVIVEDSQRLTTEAQNALLKTLEEPPQGTVLIMTVDAVQNLLPTVRSRLQIITIKKPSLTDTLSHFAASGRGETELRRLYAMTGGLPGAMQAVLDDQDHPLVTMAGRARTLLGQTTYERLLQVDQLAKERDSTAQLLTVLQEMAHLALQTASQKTALRWQVVLRAAYEAQAALNQSGQPKLVLTKLMLEL
jgi:replication-associated recombination protein RarA